MTLNPDYLSGASAPRESKRVRMLRRAELAAPHQVGWAKGIVKKVMRRG